MASDEMDTIGYAISFRLGAETLVKHSSKDAGCADIRDIIPFYALTGFSIENGLKAALEFKKASKGLKWSHSHDLSGLLRMCKDVGLIVAPEVNSFVDELSPHHMEHHFRYPQKAGEVDLPKAANALALVESLLNDVFQFIEGPIRLLRENG